MYVCEGPVVIHEDDEVECLEPHCGDVDAHHGPLETPCWLVWDGHCPRCGPTAA
jgi:hypothetical protein